MTKQTAETHSQHILSDSDFKRVQPNITTIRRGSNELAIYIIYVKCKLLFEYCHYLITRNDLEVPHFNCKPSCSRSHTRLRIRCWAYRTSRLLLSAVSYLFLQSYCDATVWRLSMAKRRSLGSVRMKRLPNLIEKINFSITQFFNS